MVHNEVEIHLAEFGTTEMERGAQKNIANAYHELAIIDRPWDYLNRFPLITKKYFPEYKELSDFNKTLWMKEALKERVVKKFGNIVLAIGGLNRSGKSSIALDMHYWIMKEISGKPRYNIGNLMFYGKSESISKMSQVESGDCLFQDEVKGDFGAGTQYFDRVQREQVETLAKSKIHRIQIRQTKDPRVLLEVGAQLCLYTWDVSNPGLEPPENINEIENELARMKDKAKQAYIYSKIGMENIDYQAEKDEFIHFLRQEYAPQIREFYQQTQRIHRAILFQDDYKGNPHFLGFTLHPTVSDSYILENYLVEKEIYQLELMTGEAHKAEFQDEIQMVLSSEAFNRIIREKDGEKIIKKKELKPVVASVLSGKSNPIIDIVTNKIAFEKLAEMGITLVS